MRTCSRATRRRQGQWGGVSVGAGAPGPANPHARFRPTAPADAGCGACQRGGAEFPRKLPRHTVDNIHDSQTHGTPPPPSWGLPIRSHDGLAGIHSTELPCAAPLCCAAGGGPRPARVRWTISHESISCANAGRYAVKCFAQNTYMILPGVKIRANCQYFSALVSKWE